MHQFYIQPCSIIIGIISLSIDLVVIDKVVPTPTGSASLSSRDGSGLTESLATGGSSFSFGDSIASVNPVVVYVDGGGESCANTLSEETRCETRAHK